MYNVHIWAISNLYQAKLTLVSSFSRLTRKLEDLGGLLVRAGPGRGFEGTVERWEPGAGATITSLSGLLPFPYIRPKNIFAVDQPILKTSPPNKKNILRFLFLQFGSYLPPPTPIPLVQPVLSNNTWDLISVRPLFSQAGTLNSWGSI